MTTVRPPTTVAPDSRSSLDETTDQGSPGPSEPGRHLRHLRHLGTTRALIWPGLVVLAVVLANFPALVGLVDVNPLGPVGLTAVHLSPGYLPGLWYSDPQIGYTAQALGHLAALDWLHGHIPWWNPYEGPGMPLAAEMESAAFFPPTLLLALAQGQLYLHMLLEVTAGMGTFLLAREMHFRRPVASLAGILFALNGTFAWFGHTAANPVAFLPLTLLGVERLYRRRSPEWTGVVVIALSLALSFYAGFPETAYLDALLAGAWFLARLARGPSSGRLRFTGKAALGALAAGLLAAPLLIAFIEYLPLAYVGVHSGQLASTHAEGPATMALGLPYLYGPLLALPKAFAGSQAAKQAWVNFGGFITAPVVALALLGLIGARRERVLRGLLALGTLVVLLWTFGVPPFQPILDRIVPGAADVWIARYSQPAWELGLVLLACFGVEAVVQRRKWLASEAAVAVALTGGLIAFDLYESQSALSPLDKATPSHLSDARLMVIYALSMVVVVGALAAASRLGPKRPLARWLPAVMATAVALDAGAMFTMPSLSAPRSEAIDTGPAAYLAAHLGNERFFSWGVYLPDYGSYFGLAALDSNDNPIPKSWNLYVPRHLARDVSAEYFGTHTLTLRPTPAKSVIRHLAAYEALGVKYVMFPSSDRVFGQPGPLYDGIKLVYRDQLAEIFALPSPQSFFSTGAMSCSIRAGSLDQATVSCPGPATLVRDELYLAGWTAKVNGRPVAITAKSGLLESVRLPAGTSTVSFSYEPANETLGLALFLLGVAVLAGSPIAVSLLRRRRTRSRRDRREHASPGPLPSEEPQSLPAPREGPAPAP